jgi:uncharacterized protein (DUF1330 family)
MEMTTLEPTIEPTQSQFQRVAASEEEGPVLMVNLVRFKERADGIDADDGIGGEEAYARYGAAVQPFLAGVGGRIVLAARATESVIGPQEGEWDAVFVAEYPSRKAFLEMAGNPGYLEIHQHRVAGVADSRLIACRPLFR